MEYRIIFYNASKTAMSEKAIVKSLSPAGFSLATSNAAATKLILGKYLSGGFVSNDLIIVVSGSVSDENGVFSVITSAINPAKAVKQEKISDFDAYLFTCDNQALLLLPDRTADISDIFASGALDLLKKFFDKSEGVNITA